MSAEVVMDIRAVVQPWSSVVGGGVTLLDADDGHTIGQVAFLCHDNRLRDRTTQERLAKTIAAALGAAGPSAEDDDKLIDAMVVAGYGGTREDAVLGLGVDGLDYGRKTMRRVLAVVRIERAAEMAALKAERDKLADALMDATASVVAAASAYRKYARRYTGITPKAEADAFFSTRADDFDRAAERARTALPAVKGGDTDGQ